MLHPLSRHKLMPSRRRPSSRFLLAVPLFLIGLGGWPFAAPAAAQAQADSSRSPQRVASAHSAPAAAGAPAVRELFRRYCVKCHGADGAGSQGRDRLPEIPDFTDASWQGRRSGAQLLASLFDGKGKEMPLFRDKVSEDQAGDLV